MDYLSIEIEIAKTVPAFIEFEPNRYKSIEKCSALELEIAAETAVNAACAELSEALALQEYARRRS